MREPIPWEITPQFSAGCLSIPSQDFCLAWTRSMRFGEKPAEKDRRCWSFALICCLSGRWSPVHAGISRYSSSTLLASWIFRDSVRQSSTAGLCRMGIELSSFSQKVLSFLTITHMYFSTPPCKISIIGRR